MNRRIIFYICIGIFLGSCVQVPVFKGDDHALVRSNYPIVSLKGTEVKPVYDMDIEAGETTLTVVYHSYQYDYACTFRWKATAGTVYEVTDHEKSYPLTLYRWVRINSLWARRMDPVDPFQCVRK
jgi:hypothetical protein